MSEIKIGTGTSVPPWKLKDAVFTKAQEGSKVYCRITTADGEEYALTSLEAFRLSNRGGMGPTRFRAWLEQFKQQAEQKKQD